MNDFTLLSEEQILGDNKLDILKKYGTKAAVTDFAIFLGVGVFRDSHTNEGNSKKDRAGFWWTKTSHNGLVSAVFPEGQCYLYDASDRFCGVRPALPYSSISLIFSNREKKYGILEVEYGEYPQTVVPEDFSKTLESAYFNRTINQTGKSYTTDSVEFQNCNTPFQPRSHIEYEYNGRKYIRFVGDSICRGEVLSDGRNIKNGVPYWIKIEPIKWMIDEQTNIALSKKVIFSGAQFDRIVNYYGNFYGTDIKEFMDKYLSKDIKPSILRKIPPEDNPYGFNFEQVSEEDIIKEAIESGIAVFLHSRLSVDKSAKVKQLDPDCEIIYMRNATPDSLNGKSVYNSEKGEMIDIPPIWYTNILKKCEKEPDKIHIIFFDELTNALPYVQSIALNIVLDRKVNGIWKLPENVRIVATGNDMEESLAPNELSERLFNMFAHVYINVATEDLLKWTSKNNIHPAIYSYIAYKNRELQLSKYDGKNPTADLKKWEMASKMLYKTKKPEMLRSLVGDNIAREFANFCKQKTITLNDVLNNNYNFNNLQLNTAEIYATVMKLSQANEDDYEKARDFVSKFGEEPTALFDMLWAHNDEKRLDIIAGKSNQRIKVKKK